MIRLRNIEVLKWVGVVCMLVDHVNLFVLGGRFPWAEQVGALAFPLFAVALGAGVSRVSSERGWSVVRRLLVWAVLAEFAWTLLRVDFMPNVIFTLAAGLSCFLLWEGERRRWLVSLPLLGSVVCAFSVVGCILVWSLLVVFRKGFSLPALACVAGSVLMLFPFNSMSHAALLVLPLLWLIELLPADLPRVRGIFYRVYAGQLPLLWLGAAMVR